MRVKKKCHGKISRDKRDTVLNWFYLPFFKPSLKATSSPSQSHTAVLRWQQFKWWCWFTNTRNKESDAIEEKGRNVAQRISWSAAENDKKNRILAKNKKQNKKAADVTSLSFEFSLCVTLLNHFNLRFFFLDQMMVALYDYNPEVQSPQDNPDSELPFKKGQVLTVVGEMVSAVNHLY